MLITPNTHSKLLPPNPRQSDSQEGEVKVLRPYSDPFKWTPVLSTSQEKVVENLLTQFDRGDRVFLTGSVKDPENHGASLTAFDALKKLDQGQSITVEASQPKEFVKGHIPGRGKMFRGRSVDPSTRKAAEASALTEFTKGECAVVSSKEELLRFAEVQGYFTPTESTPGMLSPQEQKIAEVLRNMQGTTHGTFVTVFPEDDFHYGYTFRTDPPKVQEKGLYDPNNRTGGFLGFFGKPERLTAFEALEKLKDGEQVQVRENASRAVLLSSFEDLESYQRLR